MKDKQYYVEFKLEGNAEFIRTELIDNLPDAEQIEKAFHNQKIVARIVGVKTEEYYVQ